MDWTATRPNIEIAAEWGAAIMLGAAVALALALVAPAGMVAAACGGAGAAAAAIAVQRSIAHGVGVPRAAFAPVDWPGEEEDEAEGAAEGAGEGAAEGEVLLLDEPVTAPAELLLDEPLPPPASSRVVRLFGTAPVGELAAGDAAAVPGPGEMLARIETFLGVNRGGALAAGPAAAPANAASAEASAALHAALADIRRSLRQG